MDGQASHFFTKSGCCKKAIVVGFIASFCRFSGLLKSWAIGLAPTDAAADLAASRPCLSCALLGSTSKPLL